MAAAHVAGVDGMLKVGGAQAVATMSQGIGPVPKCDIIVGPGNQWVTAAKSLVSQTGTAIDMLAGPSEVLVIADETADPATVASDLLAQVTWSSVTVRVCVREREVDRESVGGWRLFVR